MTNTRAAVTALALLVWSCSTALAADAPMLLNYQGNLTDPSGAPQSGTFSMQFAVYDAVSGGNQLPSGTPWVETQSVTVTNGVFNALLGSVSAIPTSLFEGGPSDASGPLRFLQVSVTGEALAPRQRIASAAYALSGGSQAGIPVVTPDPTGKIVLGAVTIQWGTAVASSTAGGVSILFGTAFGGTPYSIVQGSNQTGGINNFGILSITAAGFKLYSPNGAIPMSWIAIGPT